MARLGFGAGRNRAKASGTRVAQPVETATVPIITPSAAWTGTAASGFGAAPVDPVRATAKPAMRVIVPPNQAFTDELLVGVYAGANERGSLLTTMGLQKVVAHYEGSTVEIAAPSVQVFDDANGNPVRYLGWWVRLKRDGRSGYAQLYFEAVPRDSTMQNRVIGPYVFLPRAALYDHDLVVAPSLPPVTASRFQTLNAALKFFEGKTFDNARIVIAEAGTYDPGATAGVNLGVGKGRVTIEASGPVTIAKPAWPTAATASNTLASTFRPRIEPICWRGANITFDFQWATSYYCEYTSLNWFDGVRFANTAPDPRFLHRQLRSGSGFVFRNPQWFTECRAERLVRPFTGQALARGLRLTGCFDDLFNSVDLTIGCAVDDTTGNTALRALSPAMTVIYSGAGAAATIEASGLQTTTKTVTLKVDGASVGSYPLHYAMATADTGANYEVRHLVDYINTLPGWSAALIDNARQGSTLCHTTSPIPGGLFGPVSAKGTVVTMAVANDIHGDFAQTYAKENWIIADCVTTRSDMQDVFLTFGHNRDGLVLNCAWHNVGGGLSQLGHAHSHVVIAHCTCATQGYALRGDLAGAAAYSADAYCLFANNVAPDIGWAGAPDPDLTIRGTHLLTGGTVPGQATETTVGGTATTVLADPASGDFTPRGALLANRKVPVLAFDAARRARGALAPAGALA